MARKVRGDRAAAAAAALGNMSPRAAARAKGKAKAAGRQFPTSGMRSRASNRTRTGK